MEGIMILEGKLHRSRTRLKRRLGRPFLRAVPITAMVAAGGSPLITATAAHAATPPTGGNRLHVQVAASQPWTDTGIDVAVGTRVSIEAYGTIKIAGSDPVSYTHLRAHETRHDLVCRLL